MSIKTILTEARNLLAEGKWRQHDYCDDETHPTCFCALGAIAFVAGQENADFDALGTDTEVYDAAAILASIACGGLVGRIAEWNDAEGQDVDGVLAAFDAAIAKAKGGEA